MDFVSMHKRKKVSRPVAAPISENTKKLEGVKGGKCTETSCAVKRAARGGSILPVPNTPSPDDAAMAALRADGRFDDLIERFGPAGPFPKRDAFDACIRAVVYQQLHGNAARAILARLREKVEKESGASLLPCDFVPFGVDELRTVGLSRQKATYVLGCAKRWHDGEFTHAALDVMDDEQVVETLMRLKGYGQWSAQVVMLSALQRVDVMPLDDFALMKGAGIFLGGKKPSKAKVEAEFEGLRPYRSYASFYLWKLADGNINID